MNAELVVEMLLDEGKMEAFLAAGKALVAAGVIAASAMLTGCSTPQLYDKLPGHWVKNHCKEYADALNMTLYTNGIPSKEICYEWKWNNRKDSHAFIVFKKDGKLWGMDNKSWKPREVSGSTDLEIAQSFDKNAVKVFDENTMKYTEPAPMIFSTPD